jgi:hypothetical protein
MLPAATNGWSYFYLLQVSGGTPPYRVVAASPASLFLP